MKTFILCAIVSIFLCSGAAAVDETEPWFAFENPDGIQTWFAPQTWEINWEYDNISDDATINLELWLDSDPQEFYFNMARDLSISGGLFRYNLSSSISPGVYFVRAVIASIAETWDSLSVTIATSGVDITTPHNGHLVRGGDILPITWSSYGLEDQPMQLFLYYDDVPLIGIGNTTTGKGSFDYTIPANILKSSQLYQIVALVSSNSNLFKSSTFSIADSNCDSDAIAAMFSYAIYNHHNVGGTTKICNTTWITYAFYSSGLAHAGVFIDQYSANVVVAFRGTDGKIDLANSINPIPRSCEGLIANGCNGGFVSAGYYRIYLQLQSFIRQSFESVMNTTGGHAKVLIVGHSKGGALSTIAAIDLGQLYPQYLEDISVITFGSPKTGTSSFVSTFDSMYSSRSTRWVTTQFGTSRGYTDDSVTDYPFSSTPYVHVQGLTHILCPANVQKRLPDEEKQQQNEERWDFFLCHFMKYYLESLVIQSLSQFESSPAVQLHSWLDSFSLN
jgi:hypothetical protein